MQTLLQNVCLFGALLPEITALGTLLTGYLSLSLAARPGHPFTSTIVVAALVQEWPKIIVAKQCCTTVALDHISDLCDVV